MRCLPFLVMLFLFAVPATVPAETYQWTDAAGVKHFTDNPDAIPASYLNRVREIPSVHSDQKGISAPPPAVSAPSRAPSSPVEQSARKAQRADLGRERQKLQDSLATKRKELDQLRRKWTVAKGRTPAPKEIEEFEKKRAKGLVTDKDNPYIRRTPTPKEIEEFEKKRAKGPVSDKDNPYIIQGPFGMPGLAREAYYRKLDEVRQHEERIDRLRKELDALDR